MQDQEAIPTMPIPKVQPTPRHIWPALLWEARRAISWTWLLPPFIIIVSFYFAHMEYVTQLIGRQIALQEGLHPHPVVLDYVTSLRGDIERFLPLLGCFMTAGLLAQEWRRGTLTLLVPRKPPLWLLLVRLGYTFLYLFIFVLLAIFASWWLTPPPASNIDMWQWIWQTLLITLTPTLFLCTIGLLIAHASINLISGYILPACLWLSNWLFSQSVLQTKGKNGLLSFFLFGWYDRNSTPLPDNWLQGKLLLLVLSLLFLVCQIPLLRQEARFLRNSGE